MDPDDTLLKNSLVGTSALGEVTKFVTEVRSDVVVLIVDLALENSRKVQLILLSYFRINAENVLFRKFVSLLQ